MKQQQNNKSKVRFRRTKKIFLIESFQNQHRFIGKLLKLLFTGRKPICEMTYDDLAPIGIDSEREVFLIRKFTFLLRICLSCAALDYFYAMYLLIQGYIFVGFIALSILCLLLANAFKFHFWRYQLLKKKLGCSFREWLCDLSKGGKQ